VEAWAAGVQMAAMNYQTSGKGMYINHGKFLQNGNCGYVLKPRCLLDPAAAPAPARVLSVHIIAGSLLPKPASEVISPVVVVSVCGQGADSEEQRTKAVDSNGFNPVWDEVS
jgi:hypothetical protein